MHVHHEFAFGEINQFWISHHVKSLEKNTFMGVKCFNKNQHLILTQTSGIIEYVFVTISLICFQFVRITCKSNNKSLMQLNYVLLRIPIIRFNYLG